LIDQYEPLLPPSQLNTLGLESDSANYFDLLRHSKIVVTANPSTIEGDHRMWEALAAGALVYTGFTGAYVCDCIFYVARVNSFHVFVY
jgi:hypothetical protein